jgi:hypothetical protein
MTRANRFRVLLPSAECLLAAVFGGVGHWQRSTILSRPWFSEGQTMWNSTARFHVWPWVPILWYWVGSRLDRRWGVTDPTPWIALSVFTLVCLVGAFLPIGYVGFLPYGFVVWVITAVTISRRTYTCSGIPAPDVNKKISRN